MQAEAATARQRADCSQFCGRIGTAIFAGLRNADRVRLHLMHAARNRGEHCRNPVRIKFRAPTIGQQQLGSVEKEPRRAAFVAFDMRFAVTHHTAMRLDHRRQGQAIGGRAGGSPQHRAVAPEQIGKGRVELLAQRVAIIGRIRSVSRAQRIPYFGVDARRIVGEKLRGTLHAERNDGGGRS